MTNLQAGPIPTAKGIDWREARYLARVVQMLVKSPDDRAEFRRELENLLRAAEALRTGRASSHEMDWESDEFEPAPIHLAPTHMASTRMGWTPAGMAHAGAAPAGQARTRAAVEREAEWAAQSGVVELWRSAPAVMPRGVVARAHETWTRGRSTMPSLRLRSRRSSWRRPCCAPRSCCRSPPG